MLRFEQIQTAAQILSSVVHRTPVMTSESLNRLSGNRLYFKCENFQRVGAFKIRGAYHKIYSLTPEEKQRGVVTFSSGNHAQAVALASRLLGTQAKIVMPNIAPKPKVEATRAYGGEVVFYDYYHEDREAIGRKIAEEEGRIIVPPYNDEWIMSGQGTLGLELTEQVPDLEYAFFPVGGGGLISGNAVALKHRIPGIRIIGVEAETANDVWQSFRKGEIVRITPPKTIADGMRTLSPGTLTFPVIMKYVDDILLVPDEQIIQAMELIYSRLKIVVEPTAAVPLAAVLKNEKNLHHRHIGVVLSGGNIDLSEFFQMLRTNL